jgi:hypothetical protein
LRALAVLKNTIDWVYPEWIRKAAGFVSYGSAMGARSVQQLRQTAIEIQLAPDSLVSRRCQVEGRKQMAGERGAELRPRQGHR